MWPCLRLSVSSMLLRLTIPPRRSLLSCHMLSCVPMTSRHGSSYSATLMILKTFSHCPAEWPVLLSLLSLYGKASNAKVNLSKTVLVSLPGRAHSPWKRLATASDIEWCDEASTGSVRYLGYPLYHISVQLAHLLDGIKVKLQRHVNMLR